MTTFMTLTYDLPSGFDSLDQLCESDAGRVYATARGLLDERRDYHEAVNYLGLARAYAAYDGLHPECYALLFEDSSLLIVSNADDEVWSSALDYLDQSAIREACADIEPGDDCPDDWLSHLFGPAA